MTTTKDTTDDLDTNTTGPAARPAHTSDGETVWMRHPTTGVEHNVAIGTEAHKRLVADGAPLIDDPNDA